MGHRPESNKKDEGKTSETMCLHACAEELQKRTRRLRQRTQQRMTLSGKPLTLQVAKRNTTVRYVDNPRGVLSYSCFATGS